MGDLGVDREQFVRLVSWVALGVLVLMLTLSALWWAFGPDTSPTRTDTPMQRQR